MKIFVLFITSILISITTIGQNLEFGKYRLCYDMYWRCHFQNLIELKNDSTYSFTYLDDTQMKTTSGTWKIDSNYIVLTPEFIPDSIDIIEVYEIRNKKDSWNSVKIKENYKGISYLNVTCYRKFKTLSLTTDSTGKFSYKGPVVDSLVFYIEGRKMKVTPREKKKPSYLSVTIDTDNKDLIFQCLGDNKIKIENGRMIINYKDGETDTVKTEYFEKIK